jgi:hypothetical protein
MRQHRYAEAWSSVEAEIRKVIAHPTAILADEGSQRGVF